MKKRPARASSTPAALVPSLLAIPAQDVVSPAICTPRLVADALLLARALAPHARALAKVGVSRATLAAIPTAARALDIAEEALDLARRAARGRRDHRAVQEAALLRREMTAAARFALRGDADATYALDRIEDGDALDALLGDLRALGLLFGGHRAALAKAGATPDAKMRRAAALAPTVERLAALAPAQGVEARAIDLRDRAATHLARLVQDARAAAGYVFRDHPALLARTRPLFDVPRRARRHPAHLVEVRSIEIVDGWPTPRSA